MKFLGKQMQWPQRSLLNSLWSLSQWRPITGDRKEYTVGIHWVQREFMDKEKENYLQIYTVEVMWSFCPLRSAKGLSPVSIPNSSFHASDLFCQLFVKTTRNLFHNRNSLNFHVFLFKTYCAFSCSPSNIDTYCPVHWEIHKPVHNPTCDNQFSSRHFFAFIWGQPLASEGLFQILHQMSGKSGQLFIFLLLFYFTANCKSNTEYCTQMSRNHGQEFQRALDNNFPGGPRLKELCFVV